MARKSISKKLRFDVFKRDSFSCQYCGATPPSVVLHIDHIHPVSAGGSNDIDNLITACEPCNLGKSATLLTDIPKSLKDRAVETAEREEQIKGYNELLRDRAARIEDEAWEVAAFLEGEKFIQSYSRSNLLSIKRFLERLPLQEVLGAAEIANARWKYSGNRQFRYFCGICWAKIRDLEHV